MSTNLLSTMQIARTFFKAYNKRFLQNPAMARASDGNQSPPGPSSYCFVALSSLLAVKGGEGASAYAASKAGLIAFTRALALEARLINHGKPWAPSFRANVVLPGYVDTPMLKGRPSPA